MPSNSESQVFVHGLAAWDDYLGSQCGKRPWTFTGSERATSDDNEVNCPACLDCPPHAPYRPQ